MRGGVCGSVPQEEERVGKHKHIKQSRNPKYFDKTTDGQKEVYRRYQETKQNFAVVVPDSFATAATTTRRCKLSPIRWTALSWPVPQDTLGSGKHSVASFRSMSHRLNEGRTRANAFVSTSEVYTCGKTPLLVDKSILDTFRSVHGYKPRRLISRIKCAW